MQQTLKDSDAALTIMAYNNNMARGKGTKIFWHIDDISDIG